MQNILENNFAFNLRQHKHITLKSKWTVDKRIYLNSLSSYYNKAGHIFIIVEAKLFIQKTATPADVKRTTPMMNLKFTKRTIAKGLDRLFQVWMISNMERNDGACARSNFKRPGGIRAVLFLIFIYLGTAHVFFGGIRYVAMSYWW